MRCIYIIAGLMLMATSCSLSPKGNENTEPETAESNQYNDVRTLSDEESMIDLSTYAELIPKLSDYTVSVSYKVSSANDLEGNGHFLFAFSKLAENQAEEGPYMAMRLNEQRFEVSTGGWNNESIIMKGEKPERDVWHHVIYRQKGRMGELYIDGELIGKNDQMPILSEIFKEAPSFSWMGRAPFKGDRNLTDTDVADFVILDYAVSDDKINIIR